MHLTRRTPRPMAVAQKWADGTPITDYHPRLRAIQWLREKVAAGEAGLDVYDLSIFILDAHKYETVWAHRAVDLTGAVLVVTPTADGGRRFRTILEADVRTELGLDLATALMSDEPLASRAAPAACDRDDEASECEGHPAGPFGPMGETVYCDGSCLASRAAPVYDFASYGVAAAIRALEMPSKSDPPSLAAMREAKAAYDQRYPHGVEPQLVIRTDTDGAA